ncbi:GNAT family N-acetyltransferase [Echinicola sp. CAU 1574]|uniref:GNAT family N-acetyltransferase n=1 Tax=Echinicola arenosa TaxID=2774144 RepID=A0ABR9AP24_9BACT|nr:GNAT family N-acetyltransferase [Echinicola arenosa]MBD8490480.1 GNAT family N-acetyltransferase [Echinicola arenosa]
MKLIKNKEAFTLLAQEDFLKAWDKLYSACPWATIFQSKDFVLSWFENYLDDYRPIILTDWDGNHMSGLFLLTIDEKVLRVPGITQAEYQTWLSTIESNDLFITKALDRVTKEFPNYTIKLKYVPAHTPLAWCQNKKSWKNKTFLKKHLQPIMIGDEEKIDKELKKKNKKEKINRLKRKGELTFERITSIEDFKSILDELIIQSDFRKGAMFDKLTFQNEPNRKQFIIDAFKKGILHVTILRLDKEIIASNVGFMSSKVVHLQGINTHSPSYAKYSPGILHFFMLGKLVCREETEIFDLTPGGADGYKGMLANAFLETHELTICSEWTKKKLEIRGYFARHLKIILKKNNINTQKRKAFFLELENKKEKAKHTFQSEDDFEVTTDIIDPSKRPEKNVFYNIKINELPLEIPCKPIRPNKLEDFFLFDPKKSSITRKDFLWDSMKRMELGHESFTLIDKGKLAAVLWYVPANTKSGEREEGKDIIRNEDILLFSLHSKESFTLLVDFIICIANHVNETYSLDKDLKLQIRENDNYLLKLWNEHKIYESHFFNL